MKYTIFICAICFAAVACGSRGASRGQGAAPQKRAATSEVTPPANLDYRVVATYPHDPEAYTQGLFWHNGALIESTGQRGYSTLRRVALETGRVTQNVALDDRFFGEGAAIVGDKIYQLTWEEGTCFVYDAATLARTGQFTYRGEGWGLTSDGTNLYMSDGTPNITVRDPATFGQQRTIVVRNAGRTVQWINELEWIDGHIWANVYMTGQIVVIDPADGRVEAVIDLSGLVSRLDVTWATDVMNGIAWDAASGRIWVTGKNWNKLFEIEISDSLSK
jgi:glutamine cyclotransferase